MLDGEKKRFATFTTQALKEGVLVQTQNPNPQIPTHPLTGSEESKVSMSCRGLHAKSFVSLLSPVVTQTPTCRSVSVYSMST